MADKPKPPNPWPELIPALMIFAALLGAIAMAALR